MDSNQVEQMYKIMKKNNFVINDDSNSDCLCMICKKILIDACSAPCGCRYCKQCIREYLNKERKVCPGTSEYCKTGVIDVDRDIRIDGPVNIKISKLKVKCPNIICQSKVELIDMENHLRICENRFLRCPYFNVGCAEEELVNDKIGEHLLSEIDPHTKLLMEWIINSQNDSESLKKEMKQLMKDNKEMKEKMQLYEERTQNQREDLERLKSENNQMKEKMGRSENIIRHLQNVEKKNTAEINKLGEETSALRNDNRSLKETLREMKKEISENISISELRTKVEKQNKENDKLNDEMKVVRKENELLKGEMQEMRNKKISHMQFNTQMEDQIKEIDQLKQRFDNKFEIQEKKCKDIEMILDGVYQDNEIIKSGSKKSMEIMREFVDQSNHGEFIWKIENWAETRMQAQNDIETMIYSDDFFTHKNGYKMRLELDPNGDGKGKGTHLSLFFCIRRGPFDDILQWPFKHNVDLSLINQESGSAHFTRTLNCYNKPESNAFIKPVIDENIGFGFEEFIKQSEMSTNPAFTLGNQIFIKCKLSKPP